MGLTLQLQVLVEQDVRKVIFTAVLLGVKFSGTAFSSQLASTMFVKH